MKKTTVLVVGLRVRVAEKGDMCDGLEGTIVGIRRVGYWKKQKVYEVWVDAKGRAGYFYFAKRLARPIKWPKKNEQRRKRLLKRADNGRIEDLVKV